MSERAESAGTAFWGDTDDTEALQRCRTLMNTIDDGIYQRDAEGRFVAVNDVLVEMTGYVRDELLGEHISVLLGDADVSAVEREIERLRTNATERSEPLGLTVQTAAGERITCEMRVNVLEADDTVRGTVGTVRDVTEKKRPEQGVSEREQELEARSTAMDRSIDGMAILDENEEYVFVNRAHTDIYGYDHPEALIGETWRLCYDDEETDRLEEEAMPALSAEGRWRGEATGLHEDGSTFPQELSLTLLDDGRYVCVVRDVTEQRERERKIEESERRYRTLVENFPNGAVAMFDEDLRYNVAGGDILEHLEGASTEEVVGETVWERYPEEIAERLEPNFRAAIEEGETNEFEMEFRDRHWRTYTLPIRDSEGDAFAGVMMVQDITEQVERERYFSDAKAQLEAATEAGAVGTWEWHIPEDRFVAGPSFARTFGIDPDAARDGVPLERLVSSIHEADRERVEARIEDAVESCGEYEEEYRVWNTDDELRWVSARGHVECDEDGNPVTFPGALTDITERRQFEQQLEESNERLEQFAYAASHDLQEPLRMITSYLQLIERRYADVLDEDGEEFIDFAVDGADRMRNMIEGLLEYSRVDRRGDPFEPVDIDDILADVRDDLQMTIAESDAEITTESLPRVDGDEGQLRQVFQNLLDNAIEYSGDEPPQVHVSAERDGNEWMISVSDDGIGIDPEDADRVFEVFQSLHTNDEHSGTGVGLALCERIVERHGGEIRVDSEPGEGSTFTFTLPAESEHSE